MHNSAYKNAENFYNKYCDNIESKTVLDVGSCDVNGSMKPIFSKAKQYTGLDQCNGKNVDVVGSSHNLPFGDNSYDIIISSSCFEHDDMFWVTFIEMCRVLKPNGLLYIQAPSNGPYHAHPVDNWRFYKDSWKALEKWAKKNNYNLNMLEGFVDPNTDGIWNDSIGIYRKVK
jgi:ubiquinone/menaquinone biosynthesis C-methylase UbiE